MSSLPTYGEVPGAPVGEMSRRSFMRRIFWVGTGILTIEFLAGTLNFLWPNVRSGLGGTFRQTFTWDEDLPLRRFQEADGSVVSWQ